MCGMPSCPSVFVDGRYQFKQYVPTKGTTSFVCGICVGHGLFEEEMRAKRAQEGASKMKRAKKKRIINRLNPTLLPKLVRL